MGKKIEIKKLSEFEAMLNAGNTTYTGLVESVGYVYWTMETLYFIRINPEERWAIPKYRQIPFPYFQKKDAIIETKTLHTLHVLSKDELMKYDSDAYYAFYGVVEEMLKFIHRRDAIKSYWDALLPIIDARGALKRSDKGNGVLSLGRQINDQIGAPLDAANMLMDNKHIGKIGDGLSLISIIDEVGNGEYWSAAGDVLLFAAGKTKLSPYLTAISLGTWMYDTGLMQWRLACANYKDFKEARAQYEYYRGLYERGNRSAEKKMNKYFETMSYHYKEMQNNLHKLGVNF